MRAHYILILAINFMLGRQVATAQVTEPSQGGSVSVTRVTATTMELSFGKDGTGQGRVLAIAATNGPSSVPLAATNNNFYTADSTYGQGSSLGRGYTVYTGKGHTATVTGLQPNTYYYITNAEYNTDSTSIIYNTRGSSVIMPTRRAVVVNPTPLPVELTSFTGAVDAQNSATLRWATASEHNAAYFALERSTEGNSFTEIGRVEAAGTSDRKIPYHWFDPQRLTKLTYYRLRQADTDGTLFYSSVLALSPSNSQLTKVFEVYPNPSAGQAVQLLLQGYSGELLTLRLTDTMGRMILAQSLTPSNGNYLVPLSLPYSLATGTYVITLVGNGPPTQRRLVISGLN